MGHTADHNVKLDLNVHNKLLAAMIQGAGIT